MKPDDLRTSTPSGIVAGRMTTEEAAELAGLRARRMGYERFHDFVARVAPRYRKVPKHLQPLYDLVERSREEPIRSLVSMPPRHGKSVTLCLALAWRVMLDPACQNFYTSFHSSLSEFMGRTVRQLAIKLGIPLDRSSKSNSEWNTVYGGGLLSTSLGGAIMGRGANGGLVVVDDIIKGWKTAQSKQARDDAHTYITTDVMSRLEGGGSLIVFGSRWHEDDPIGRIAADMMGESFTVINLPAIGDINGDPVDERIYPELARPLWTGIDETHPNDAEAAMSWYKRIRGRGERQWWALYQGVPRGEGEKMFLEPGRFVMPMPWKGKRGVLVLDPAATEKTSSDFSALGAFAMDGFGDESRMYVARAKKMHVTQPVVAREAHRWQRKLNMLLAVEAVGGFSGIPQMLRETSPGIRLLELKPGSRGWISGDKKTRAIPMSGAWNNSRVLVPTADVDVEAAAVNEWTDLDWVDDFIEVIQAFTGTRAKEEDDVVDITAHAWNILYRISPIMRQREYDASF